MEAKHADSVWRVERAENTCAGWVNKRIPTLRTLRVFTEHTQLSSNHSWKWKQTTV